MSAPTICAVATPPGPGGVGVLRISGPRAEAIARALCPSLPSPLDSHRLHLARAIDPRHPEEPLDEVLAVVMRGPRSYTGEDVAELQGHGGPLNMARLLEAALAAGAELAQPGEFTRRAFLNGRMDLTQAEAVADIIHASSLSALRLAQRHLAGRLGREVHAMRAEVLEAVVLTEAAIDFSTEEHVYQLDAEALAGRLERLDAGLGALLGTFDAGRQAREGVQVVILGRPNAGKSTLFNALCGQPRAIVTELPGTTRDYLEERVLIGQVALCLVDTAGLRGTDDQVERLGVDRALARAREADLALWLIDGAAPWAPEPRELEALRGLEGADVLPLINKADLPDALGTDGRARIEALAGRPALEVSLLGEKPPEALLEALGALARARVAPAGEGAVITRARHREALLRAQEALTQARETALMGMGLELIALDLRLALEALGELVGQVTVDDILHRIFSDFCVGK